MCAIGGWRVDRGKTSKTTAGHVYRLNWSLNDMHMLGALEGGGGVPNVIC